MASDSQALRLHSKDQRSRIFKKLKKFVYYHIRGAKTGKTIELPIFGNIGLKVHRGYKLFDFKKKIVTKLFYNETPESERAKEIQAVKMGGRLDFAPRFESVNHQHGYYQESFIKGQPCMGRYAEQSKYSTHQIFNGALECIKKMVVLLPFKKINLASYVKEILSETQWASLSDSHDAKAKLDRIEHFMTSFADRILNEDIRNVELMFTHGDFSLVNILNTKNGIRVIDWEGADFRSPYYDLYNYFLTEIYYGRSNYKITNRIAGATEKLNAHLVEKMPELSESLRDRRIKIYRWLYYLERTRLLMEREPSQKVVEVIHKSLDVFSTYEKQAYTLE